MTTVKTKVIEARELRSGMTVVFGNATEGGVVESVHVDYVRERVTARYEDGERHEYMLRHDICVLTTTDGF